VGGQTHALAALPLGMTRHPLYRRLGGPQEDAQNLAPPPGFGPRNVQSVATELSRPIHQKKTKQNDSNSNRPVRQETCALTKSVFVLLELLWYRRSRTHELWAGAANSVPPSLPTLYNFYKLAGDWHTLLPTPTQKSRCEERPVRVVMTLKYDKCH
jgi:hypothetical protein